MTSTVPAQALPTISYEEIERVPVLSREEFVRNYERKGRPVVMRGGTPLNGWTRDRFLQAFREQMGASEMTALKIRNGRLKDDGLPFGRVVMNDFLDALGGSTHPGWHVSAPLAELPPDLLSRFETPEFIRGSAFLKSRVWIAPSNTLTPLHWDLPANFLASYFGRRFVLLFSPVYSLALYPHTPFAKTPNFSSYDPEQRNIARYPLARFARPVGTILEPGDLLFIPSRWWHHIRTIETSLIVNHWFGGQAMKLAWNAGGVFKSMKGIYKGEWKPAA